MTREIPIIDLTPFHNDDAEGKQAVARAVDAACREMGFLVISGHGVDGSLEKELYHQGRAFFDLGQDEKLIVRRPRNDQNRGYIPYGEETLVRMAGGDSPPDYKEVFAIGPYDVPNDEYHAGPGSYPNFAPNLWPQQPIGLQGAMKAYFTTMDGLMGLVLRAMALALDLPEHWFAGRIDKPTSQLRLLYYPPPAGDMEPGQLRCGEHSDVGMLTILRNEVAPGGLEVRSPSGEWILAPAIDGTFIVNLGDLMQRWTNDRWVSTKHRVAVPPADVRAGSHRMSIAHFCGPNYDQMVECMETCTSPDHPARYEPVLVHDYRNKRFAAGAGPNVAAE